MKTTHTPTPWYEHDGMIYATCVSNGLIIPRVNAYDVQNPAFENPRQLLAHDDGGAANAALIVKAVNEREEILQTVRSAMTILERDRDAMQGWHILAGLLAKAESE